MQVTEHQVQDALYHFLRARACWPILPNIDCITGYEADILVITKAGYAHEYEIKLTLSDFRADLKKRHKHASLSGATKIIPHPFWKEHAPDRYQKELHVLAESNETGWFAIRDQCYPDRRPKRFWYVIHGFAVPEGELPPYAGLMRFTPSDHPAYQSFEILKEAPDLPAKPMDEKHIHHACQNMLWRYWNYRCKV